MSTRYGIEKTYIHFFKKMENRVFLEEKQPFFTFLNF